MNILAFGTGMRLDLGQFDADWTGAAVTVNRLAWRPLVQTGTLRWYTLPVREPHWEVR